MKGQIIFINETIVINKSVDVTITTIPANDNIMKSMGMLCFSVMF